MVWLSLFLLVAVAAIGIAYSRSAAVRAQRQANISLATLIDIDRNLQKQDEYARSTFARVAGSYVQEVRFERLQGIPIDELKKYASGARLHALKDHGIRSLADVQGWSAGRLTQIRGVGPKSASLIAFAINVLTAQSNALPIPHPVPTSSRKRDRQLLEATYCLRWNQANIPGKRQELQPFLMEFQNSRKRVRARASFLHWVAGFDGNEEVQNGIMEASATANRLVGDGPVAQLRRELVKLLGQANALRGSGVDWELIVKDYAADTAGYTSLLTGCLGPAGEPATSKPFAVAHDPVTVRAAAPPPVHVNIPAPPPSFSIPQSRSQASSAFWVPPGHEVTIKGYSIKGGMNYVGCGLAAVNGGGCEPSLIDPSKSVAQTGVDCHVRNTHYWPSYDSISSEARASYLQWLSLGKSDPAADVGYVFLHFYGLERRVLVDAEHDSTAKAELPVIEEEVRRLLGIYGNNGSFRSYAGSLLDYLVAKKSAFSSLESLLQQSAASFRGLNVNIRVGLGVHAQSGKPLPAEWAVAWYMCDPNTPRFQAMTRCPDIFASLFKAEYVKRFGEGLKLPANKTRIRVTHRPASQSFSGKEFHAMLELPDVSVLTGPIGKLKEVGDACYAQLASYSRFLASHPGKEKSFEALLLLPVCVWPERICEPFRDSRRVVEATGLPMILQLQEFLSTLPKGEPLNRVRFKALSRALGGFGLGIEPDPRFGGDVPEPEDTVSLFKADGLDQDCPLSEGYVGAALMLQMAAAVASAAHAFKETEASVILDHINNSLQIPEAERHRLAAKLPLYRATPPSISGLKKHTENLSKETRETIADFLLTVALADGVVNPAKVRTLERLNQIMGIDLSSLYSKLHNMETQPVSERAPTRPQLANEPSRSRIKGSICLDTAKIAALRADSSKVSVLLGNVFAGAANDEHEELPEEKIPESVTPSLLGLDTEHSGLLQVLIQRTEWSRDEFEELCSDRGLMLDGAIERINEASFDQFNNAIIEGEDPMTVNSALLQEAMA